MNPVNEYVSNQIIELLEKGVVPWESEHFTLDKKNIITPDAKPYSAMNQLLLSQAPDTYFMTLKQARKSGSYITDLKDKYLVTYWNQYEQAVANKHYPHIKQFIALGNKAANFPGHRGMYKKGNKWFVKIPVLRYHYVFGISNIEDLDDKYLPEDERISRGPDAVKDFITSMEAAVSLEYISGEEHRYDITKDHLSIRKAGEHATIEDFYLHAFGMLIHWTGHRSRLSRNLSCENSFEEYGKEMLTAGIGSAMLAKHMNVDIVPMSASVCSKWALSLRADHELIVHAASRADKAVSYLIGLYQGKTATLLFDEDDEDPNIADAGKSLKVQGGYL